MSSIDCNIPHYQLRYSKTSNIIYHRKLPNLLVSTKFLQTKDLRSILYIASVINYSSTLFLNNPFTLIFFQVWKSNSNTFCSFVIYVSLKTYLNLDSDTFRTIELTPTVLVTLNLFMALLPSSLFSVYFLQYVCTCYYIHAR